MEAETATVVEAYEQGRILQQQNLQGQQSTRNTVAEETHKMEHAPDELQAAAASVPAHEPERAVAEQVAEATLAALNTGAVAHPMTANPEHAAASSLPQESPMVIRKREAAEDSPASLEKG